jgi:hypothetical protein
VKPCPARCMRVAGTGNKRETATIRQLLMGSALPANPVAHVEQAHGQRAGRTQWQGCSNT